MLRLSFGIEYADLQQRAALLVAHAALAPKAESELLIALAPQLEDFVAQLFRIEEDARALAEKLTAKWLKQRIADQQKQRGFV